MWHYDPKWGLHEDTKNPLAAISRMKRQQEHAIMTAMEKRAREASSAAHAAAAAISSPSNRRPLRSQSIASVKPDGVARAVEQRTTTTRGNNKRPPKAASISASKSGQPVEKKAKPGKRGTKERLCFINLTLIRYMY